MPVLGICYGMQTMAAQLGGTVEPGRVREFGYAEVRGADIRSCSMASEDRRNAEGHGLLDVWMSHGDKVTALPPGFATIWQQRRSRHRGDGRSAARLLRGAVPSRSHAHEAGGCHPRALRADICGCAQDWNMADYVDEAVAAVRAQVGDGKVILGLSGGVDSSVAAALIHKAIGDQLTCVFVDHGLLRQDEATQVLDTFSRNLGVRVVHVDAGDEMYAALDGVADPEQKRRIIGRLLVDVFQRESARLAERGNVAKWLAQGTIYPDVIESAGAKTKKAHSIKSHHKRRRLAGDVAFEAASSRCGSSSRMRCASWGSRWAAREMVYRHPFPGPGSWVRILGAVKREHAALLRARRRDLHRRVARWRAIRGGVFWYDLTAQAFAVFLPVRSVGVIGDGRIYEHVVALRAVQPPTS